MDSFDPHIGSALTLRSMLDGDISLVIPDMQRDYCWDRRRVKVFTDQLVDLFEARVSVTMGLLYGYESPRGSHRLMLIDGQQRITTLYLILGMLYRRTPEPWLRRLLISDYELSDDCQPRLIYQVRNEAMYFMSDLVTNFFLNRDGRLSQIRESYWYFNSYDADPTVTAVLAAINAIDDVLETASMRQGWDFREFAIYVADRLLFVYHDLGSRAEAERMFVTINTTGEPLTRPQMIKTELYLLASDKEDFVRRWSGIERWCFIHRDTADDVHPDTGDSVLSRFLRLWEARCEVEGYPAIYDSATFDSICKCHDLYCRLVDEVPDAIEMQPDMPEQLFVMLPALEYIGRWGGGVVPLWNMLRNVTRYRRVSSSGADTLTAMRLVRAMTDSDIVSLLRVKGHYDRVLNEEERCKLILLADSGPRREEVAALIDRCESHHLLNGCVMSVVGWCRDKTGHTVDIDRLRRYIDRIYEIWPRDIESSPDLDLVRRALLSLRHPAYPMARRNGASLSLAWHSYDWQRLMTIAPGLIRQLIDRIGGAVSATDSMHRLCDNFSDRSYEWSFLVHGSEVMAMCAHRMIMRPCERFVGMHVAGREGETRWYVDQILLKPNLKEFTNIHPYGSRCIYTDHRTLNLAVDIYWEPESRHHFRLEVFSRSDDDRRSSNTAGHRDTCDIKGLLGSAGIVVSYDKKRRRHYAVFADARSVAAAFNRITNRLL